MRVTVLCPTLPPHPGGVSDHVAVWCAAMTGLEVAVVTGPGADPLPGVAMHAVPAAWGPGAAGALAAAIAATRPDVVLIQYVPHLYERRGLSLGIPPLLARLRALRLPVVVLAHELYYGRHEGWRVQPFGVAQRYVLWRMMRDAARIVVTVPDRATRLAKLFPAHAAKLALIPIGANLGPVGGDREAWRVQAGIPPDALALLFLGLAHPSKEVGHLIAALDALQAANLPARLLVMGGAKVIHPWAVNYGFAPAPEVAAALAHADMALLPLADGASTRRTSLMNALGAGLPVVTTAGSNTDLALFASLGLVPAGDAAAFAREVVALAQDAAARQARGAAGQALFEAHFAWPALAQRWREVLSTARSPGSA